MSSAGAYPDSQIPQTFVRERNAPITRALAERLSRVAKERHDSALGARGARMLRCATAIGFACHFVACPRCQATRSKKLVEILASKLRTIPSSSRLVFVTTTVVNENLFEGLPWLVSGLTSVRRLPTFRTAVLGGEVRIQVKPTRGKDHRWNAHAHAIWELAPEQSLRRNEIRNAWSAHMVSVEAFGSLDIQTVTHRFGRYGGGSPLARYVCMRDRKSWLSWSDDEVAHAVQAFAGRRTVTRFGSWRGRPHKRERL